MLNTLLFVPAASFGVLAQRRATRIVLSAFVCSAAIEAIQLVTALGSCQTADVVRNVIGAAVASAAEVATLRAHARTAMSPDTEPARSK